MLALEFAYARAQVARVCQPHRRDSGPPPVCPVPRGVPSSGRTAVQVVVQRLNGGCNRRMKQQPEAKVLRFGPTSTEYGVRVGTKYAGKAGTAPALHPRAHCPPAGPPLPRYGPTRAATAPQLCVVHPPSPQRPKTPQSPRCSQPNTPRPRGFTSIGAAPHPGNPDLPPPARQQPSVPNPA